MSTDIAAFLLARIAEDEEGATHALSLSDFGETREWRWVRFYGYSDHPTMPSSNSFHRGAPTPEVVLATCAAHRAIVEANRPVYAVLYRESERLLASAFEQETVHVEGSSGPMWPRTGAEATLRSLASIYAEHPDYDPAWSIDTPT